MLELQSQLKKRKKSKNASKLSSSGKSEVDKDKDCKKSGRETFEDHHSFRVKEEQTPAPEISQPQTKKQSVTPQVSQKGKDIENRKYSGHQPISRLLPSNVCVGNGEKKMKNGSILPSNKDEQKREKCISKTMSPKSDSKSVVSNNRGSVLVLCFSSKILSQVMFHLWEVIEKFHPYSRTNNWQLGRKSIFCQFRPRGWG